MLQIKYLFLIAPITVFLFILFSGKNLDILAGDKSQRENLVRACPIQLENREVRGFSLEPLIKSGAAVKIALDTNLCLPIHRDDIVAYRFASNDTPLLKVVRGIPGDTFSFIGDKENSYQLFINKKILNNSQGNPYIFSEKAYNLLSLYINDYKGVIPENAYLILGNDVHGSLDSTSFGLIHRKDILGKVPN